MYTFCQEFRYVRDLSYQALQAIGSDHSLLFSPETNERFEGLFSIDINYWDSDSEITDDVKKVYFMHKQWVSQRAAANLFALASENRPVPDVLLNRMANILSYQLDESRLKKIRDRDFSYAMSFVDNMSLHSNQIFQNQLEQERDEALEEGKRLLTYLQAQVAESLGQIGENQDLPDSVIRTMENLNSSETTHPDLRQALQTALASRTSKKKSSVNGCEGAVEGS